MKKDLFDIGEYLDYQNCKCRKRLIDNLVEECSENIDGKEIFHNNYENVCNSFKIYIVLFAIALLTIIDISSAFVYFHWYLKNAGFNTYVNTNKQKIIC